MWIGLPSKTVALLVGFGLLVAPGCAQTGSNFTLPRRTSMGTLKTSLSRLEYENQQLKREVAQLKTDNRDIEDRLVQEEAHNGELVARLNDARHLLGQRGLDLDAQSTSTAGHNPGDDRRRETIPVREPGTRRRKAPFTQIPGRIEAIPPPDTDPDTLPFDSEPGDRSSFSPRRRLEDPDRWLPIAHGATASKANVR